MKVLFVAIMLFPLLMVNAQHQDDYGAIRWEDEKARLDNYAIQLQHEKDLIGYILVFAENGQCPGEAQARAMCAKRYQCVRSVTLSSTEAYRGLGLFGELKAIARI